MLFITVALAAFYITYNNILKTLSAYLGSPAALSLVGIAIGFAFGLLLISATFKGLEKEADHYAAVNGYSEKLRDPLSKIPARSGFSRLFDPHPIYRARASAINGFEEPSWHVRAIAAPTFLMSLAFVAHFAQLLASRIGVAVLITLGPALMFAAFLTALFTAYVVLYVHKALGVKPWDSRVAILAFYLGALITTHFNLGTEGIIATTLAAPLLVSRGLRDYFILLAPFLIIMALNFTAVILVNGFLHS